MKTPDQLHPSTAVLYHRQMVILTDTYQSREQAKMNRIQRCFTAGMLVMLPIIAGCEGKQTPAPSQAQIQPPPQANDFPTQARVEYVLQCMLEHGGQNYDNLYHCVCSVDKIASQMSYDDFSQAQTFTYLFNTPGERGGEFRDPPQSSKLRTQLKEAKALAAQACFPNGGKAPSPKN